MKKSCKVSVEDSMLKNCTDNFCDENVKLLQDVLNILQAEEQFK